MHENYKYDKIDKTKYEKIKSDVSKMNLINIAIQYDFVGSMIYIYLNISMNETKSI